jgi:hypothetical protein
VHEAYEGKVRELLGNVGTHLPQLDAHQLTGALRDISDYTTP